MDNRIQYIFIILIFYTSCSLTEPKIESLDWSIIYRQIDGNVHEELIMFLRFSDEDDDEDVDIIKIIATESKFEWEFQKNQWMVVKLQNVEYWGIPAILPIDGLRFTSEIYTVKIIDKAGLESQRNIRPNSSRPFPGEVEIPEVWIENNKLMLSRSYNSPVLILRNSGLQTIEKFPAENGMNIPKLDDLVWWEVWINLSDIGSGIRIGPNRLVKP